VRLRDGQCLFAREPNRFDAITVWAFLRLIQRRTHQSRRRVVVITDNAKYHHAKLHRPWREAHERQFQLDDLPSYSPELNRIERVWKLTRKLCIHDVYFPNLEGELIFRQEVRLGTDGCQVVGSTSASRLKHRARSRNSLRRSSRSACASRGKVCNVSS
jgi:transposase